MKAHRQRLFGVAVALGLAGLLWWWDPTAVPHPPPPATPPPLPTQILPPPHAWPNDEDAGPPRLPQWPRPQPTAADPCPTHQALACHEGDVFWIDGCGRRQERAEDCGGRGCDDALCHEAPAREQCGRITAAGECSGQVAEACVDGHLVRVDCASLRERCVMTGEGATCLPLDDKLGCRGTEPPRCEGNQLRLCVDGRFRTIDCAARRGYCSNQGAFAHCEADTLPILQSYELQPGELCDTKDNDSDGRIDEGGACDEVPLVAFIPQGAQLADLELRMEQELQIVNRIFAPTRFRWAFTRDAPGSYRIFDPKYIERAADDLAKNQGKQFLLRNPLAVASNDTSGGLDFYIPVLFTERLDMRPPKAGLSTLPNARCGGVRVSDAPSPVSGIVILTEARQPETLAHELGHYLGLCHTHEQVSRFAVQSSDAAESCERTGDAICDTPDDPGSPSCYQAEPCELRCHAGERPDPFNIMSYYFGCRRELSAQQRTEIAENLRLRREWFRCLDPRDCPCDPNQRSSCPADMSCHPSSSDVNAVWQCELDGPNLPGTQCRTAEQCADRAFCVGNPQTGRAPRCVRPCQDEAECGCTDVGLPVRVCSQDME
ncbi:MAG: M43 family zinc metalloprotease [Polyangiales bacterium]